MRWAMAVWVMSLALAAAGARGAELIANGGFEQAKTSDALAALAPKVREYYAGTSQSPFAGWTFGGRWEGGDYSVRMSDEAHTGSHSCQIVCNRKGRGGVASSAFQLPAGTIIKVSFWMKAKDANGGRISLNFEGSPGDGWDGKDLKGGTYDWTRFTKRAVVPGRKAGGMQTIVLFFYTRAEGSVWIDDVSVETVDVNAMAEAPDEPAAGPRMPKAIAEPAGSAGYRVDVVSPLVKVFREDDFAAAVRDRIDVSAGRNEYESMQVVVEAPWRAVTVKEVRLSDLTGPNGAVIPASALTWNRVDYVETTTVPPYFAERGLGWYPDPLMPAGAFTVEKLSRTPVWITLKTPKECPAGNYSGSVTIVPEGLKGTTIPIRLKLWDFTVPEATHIRTLTWMGGGEIRAFYGNNWSPEGNRRHEESIRNYEKMLLEHRLGPGGNVAAYPVKKKDGTYDYAALDGRLEKLIKEGMNSFIIGSAPNLRRAGQKEYTPQFVRDFSEMIRGYCEHLKAKGWQDMAYVYTYDEAPRSAWPEVKKIAAAIKKAAPTAKILQCLNEPEGVKELTGFIDVFDVYVTQYHKAGVAASQKRGAEVWLAICCYPMDHPNFFLEYPLVDVRVTPWFCWKYKAGGFEYWSTTSWGANWQKKGEKWPKAPWVANAFGRYNGDGYLMYPGEDLQPYSSIRFEALRDGFEDYEYLWMLNALVKKAEAAGKASPAVEEARKLLALDEVIKDSGSFTPDAEKYTAVRERMGNAIVELEKAVGR